MVAHTTRRTEGTDMFDLVRAEWLTRSDTSCAADFSKPPQHETIPKYVYKRSNTHMRNRNGSDGNNRIDELIYVYVPNISRPESDKLSNREVLNTGPYSGVKKRCTRNQL